MMKQAPSATRLLPSRICRWLLAVCVLKLALFCSLAFEFPQEPQIILADSSATVQTYSKDAAATPEAVVPVQKRTQAESALPNTLLGDAPKKNPQQSLFENLPVPRIYSGKPALAADDFAMPVPKVKPLESPVAPPQGEADTAVSATNAQQSGKERGIDASQNSTTTNPPPDTSKKNVNMVIPPAVAGQSSTISDSMLRQQEDLARREQDVLSLKQQMEDRLEELRAVEARVQSMLKEAQGVKDERTRQLVLMYGNMKAKQAALALEQLDERIAVRILSNMAGKQAGEILSYMKPAKTAKLSELLTRMQLGD